MAITSGFFNSIGADRAYSAEDMSRIFDGIINDGIFDSVGNHFQVSATGTGRNIKVGTGRAWLNSTWTLNDADYPLTLDNTTSSSYSRIDAVCIKVDHSDGVRANSIVVVKGTQAASPSNPSLPANDTANGIYYHLLAYVRVSYNATLTDSNITNKIGMSDGTPYVTGILATTSVDELWATWNSDFNAWWDTVKSVLDTDTVTRLQNEIDHLKPSNETILKYFSSVAAAGDNPTDAILSQISSLFSPLTDYQWVRQKPAIVEKRAERTEVYSSSSMGMRTESSTDPSMFGNPSYNWQTGPNGDVSVTWYAGLGYKTDGTTLTLIDPILLKYTGGYSSTTLMVKSIQQSMDGGETWINVSESIAYNRYLLKNSPTATITYDGNPGESPNQAGLIYVPDGATIKIASGRHAQVNSYSGVGQYCNRTIINVIWNGTSEYEQYTNPDPNKYPRNGEYTFLGQALSRVGHTAYDITGVYAGTGSGNHTFFSPGKPKLLLIQETSSANLYIAFPETELILMLTNTGLTMTSLVWTHQDSDFWTCSYNLNTLDINYAYLIFY